MILVVGATGLVGGEVCRRLAAQGTSVRALVRKASDPSRVAALDRPGIEIVRGDLRDEPSLAAACRGIDAVVCTASSMPFSYLPGVNDIATTDLAGVAALVAAARSAGVRRLVYVSMSGQATGSYPLRDAKRTIEGRIRDSGLEYAILRPSYFMEVWLTPLVGFDPRHGTATVYGTGDQLVSWISTRDVAAFAVACLDGPETRAAVLDVGGPRPVSPLEIVALCQVGFGHPITVTFVSEETLAQQLRKASDPMARSFTGMMLGNALGDAIDMSRTRQLLPGEPIPVEWFVRAILPSGSAPG